MESPKATDPTIKQYEGDQVFGIEVHSGFFRDEKGQLRFDSSLSGTETRVPVTPAIIEITHKDGSTDYMFV